MLTFYYRRECYEALGLSTESTEAEVKRRYRQLSLLYHPGNYFKLNLLHNFIRICILDKNSNPNANAVMRKLIEIHNKLLTYYKKTIIQETIIISDSDEEEESEDKAEEKTEDKPEDKPEEKPDEESDEEESDEESAGGRVSNLHLFENLSYFSILE